MNQKVTTQIDSLQFREARSFPRWTTNRAELVHEAMKNAILRDQAQKSTQVEIAGSPRAMTSVQKSDAEKVINLPQFKPLEYLPAQSSMAAMQEWEGVVTDVIDGTVYASLVDITAGRRSVDESAEIPLTEFETTDRPGLQRGTIFRWAIGYLKTEKGQRIGASVMRLRPSTPIRGAAEVFVTPMVFE